MHQTSRQSDGRAGAGGAAIIIVAATQHVATSHSPVPASEERGCVSRQRIFPAIRDVLVRLQQAGGGKHFASEGARASQTHERLTFCKDTDSPGGRPGAQTRPLPR